MSTQYGYRTVEEQGVKRETLIVDNRGRAVLIREPRKVGFAPPKPKDAPK